MTTTGARTFTPDPAARAVYDELYGMYLVVSFMLWSIIPSIEKHGRTLLLVILRLRRNFKTDGMLLLSYLSFYAVGRFALRNNFVEHTLYEVIRRSR